MTGPAVPNGWNEYARLVLDKLENQTKAIEQNRAEVGTLGRQWAVTAAEVAHLRDKQDDLADSLVALAKAQAEDKLELAKRSVLYALGTTLITGVIVGVVSAVIARGGI